MPSRAIGKAARSYAEELERHLKEGIAPFWRERAADPVHGGYLTNFGGDGRLQTEETDKLITTQTRLVWCFTMLAEAYGDEADLKLAAGGVRFLLDHFWDREHGGFAWRVSRGGEPLDRGKLTFGQSFALYALSDYARVASDEEAASRACELFDLMERHARDRQRSGYLENLKADWSQETEGAAGHVKSLDVHLHVMEAYTSLAQLTNDPRHLAALGDVTDIITERMIDKVSGCGGNQYDLDFRPQASRPIPRTWNDERAVNEAVEVPTDLTSYGHNLELGCLLMRAIRVLGRDEARYAPLVDGLASHALRYGLDREFGGLYRDGPRDGPANVLDKEFWQNAEALPGFLEAYMHTGNGAYFEAFENVWAFSKKHLVHEKFGEWRVLCSRRGEVIDPNLGNPWKVFYHTGRGAYESVLRLRSIR